MALEGVLLQGGASIGNKLEGGCSRYISKKHIPITIIVLFKNEKSFSSCCRFVTRHVIVLEIRLLLAWYFSFVCS